MATVFEQQPRESAKAFAAFSEYLAMGPQRSLARLSHNLGRNKALMKRWSSRFHWQERVQAHAAHLAEAERQATESAVQSKAADWLARQTEQREEEWRVRGELLEASREALKLWKQDGAVSLQGIARMLELASKLGRLACGMPTDRTEAEQEVTAKIDVEWEMALKRVYGQPSPAQPRPVTTTTSSTMPR